MPAGFFLSLVQIVEVVGVKRSKFLELVQVCHLKFPPFQHRHTRFIQLGYRPADMRLSHPEGIGDIDLGQREVTPIAFAQSYGL